MRDNIKRVSIERKRLCERNDNKIYIISLRKEVNFVEISWVRQIDQIMKRFRDIF